MLASMSLVSHTIDHGSIQAEVLLQGAHCWRFTDDGHERLFQSRQTRWQVGEPVRGGIPLCWPWLGGHPDHPEWGMHGPLRTWPFELIDEHIDGDAVTVQLQTTITPDQHGVVAPCQVTVAHRFAPGRLTVMWATTNLGSLPQPSAGALHTYLAADARQAVISGFDGCHWVGPDDSDEQGTVEGVISHPVGRTMTMRDGSGIELRSAGTTCAMRQDGARCTVVWNPGPGHGIADLAEDETDAFICIEASNKGDERVIAPGTTHDVQVDYCFS